MQLPSLSKPIVAVRFCPVLFKPCSNAVQTAGAADEAAPAFGLPYRCVFAAATADSVLIYDTEVSRK